MFASKTLPTTILLVVIYATIFISVLVTDKLPEVPDDQQGLDLDQAWVDLHKITVRPHPYNSRANDDVRSYLLSRLTALAAKYPSRIEISDDLFTNVAYIDPTPNIGVYFEGTNIVVKVDGTDPRHLKTGGVLFSAHYDSVSTAPGVTDDGMGVVTLLQMIELLAENRPKRTAVFNLNNGEEDGLHGAYAFVNHSWAKYVDTFLNLEGAGAGGRPILFRATSRSSLTSFRAVPHPHANVLAADAFSMGLVRSNTDYAVYAGPGMGLEGLDFAFYKHRSRYHTKWDSIPGTEGGRRALWSMMETARAAGLSLLNDDATHGGPQDAVYFDLFASGLIIFSLRTLLVANVLLLVFGPILVTALLFQLHSRHCQRQQSESLVRQTWTVIRSMGRVARRSAWLQLRFWLSLLVVVASEALLISGYIKINRFVIYSHQYLVMASMFSLAYLALVAPSYVLSKWQMLAPEQEKLNALLHIYILSWLWLTLTTILVSAYKIGGMYFITAYNAALLLASVLAVLQFPSDLQSIEGTRRVRGVRFERDEGEAEDNGTSQGVEVETQPTEITPLVSRGGPPSSYASNGSQRQDENQAYQSIEAMGYWVTQILAAVPVPVMLIAPISVLLVESLGQTLADGSSPLTVYTGIAILVVLMVLPLAPFSIKLHPALTRLVALTFILTTTYTYVLAFPFSATSPLKVFFMQSLEVQGNIVLNATTHVTSIPAFLQDGIIPVLPSTWDQEVRCNPDRVRKGLWQCGWASGRLVPSNPQSQAQMMEGTPKWFNMTVRRIHATLVRVTIKATNTRNCRIYLDTPATAFTVLGSGPQQGYSLGGEKGFSELRLWSRTWGHEFAVDISGAGSGNQISGSVACEWADHEKGWVGLLTDGLKMPAYEEVLKYVPAWVTVSKLGDGLVEVSEKFQI